MVFCNKCEIKYESIYYPRHILGDGECKKHGKFFFDTLKIKELCPECAKEKNICQICGKKLKKEKEKEKKDDFKN
jgi:hypothetical protein